MKTEMAVAQLASLAQDTRLEVFRRLVRRGPEGMAAGEIAEALGIPKPTLSFHLSHLERSGLVSSTRVGRSIRYNADYRAATALVAYLYENCCADGSCAPADALVAAPRAPRRKKT